jgi:hypothetical protein
MSKKGIIAKSREAALASTKPAISIIDAISDPDIFGKWFKNKKSFGAWICLLKVIFGLPLDAEELALFQRLTGRTEPTPLGYLLVALVVGRRGGKSLFLALLAAFLAAFYDWTPFLNDSEKGTIVIVAADKKQGRAIFRYLSGMLKVPLLAGRITRETADSIELSNGIVVEIMAANFRTVRGYTIVAALADELAFWSSDETGANPDVEIINAIRPAMATIPSAMLLMASSPYAKRGVLWDTYKRHFGVDDSATLVVQADTRTMNPSVPESFIADAYEADPANAAAEYGGAFRSDISSFIDLELVEAAVDQGVVVRPRRDGVAYHSGIDPSGGQKDSFCAAVSHNEDGIVVLDALLEIRAPFNSDQATESVATLLKSYGLSSTTSDRYGAGWVVDAFAKHGIKIRHSERDRSRIYLDCLPLFTAGKARLLDNPRLLTQFASLERKTSVTGRDQVNHPPGGRDDACNAAALSMVLASVVKKPMTFAVPDLNYKPSLGRAFDLGITDLSTASTRPGGNPLPSNYRR